MRSAIYLAFTLLLLGCNPKLSKNTEFILAPMGEVSPAAMDTIREVLNQTYGINVEFITQVALPEKAFVNIKSPRYRADSLLIYLNGIRKAEGADFCMGITSKDISVTKRDSEGNIKKPESKYRDWGIFGLAYRPGRASIISTFRLPKMDHRYYSRIKKITVHEFGHNLGLPHCPDKNCVMTDAAESIKTIDACAQRLCEECSSKVF